MNLREAYNWMELIDRQTENMITTNQDHKDDAKFTLSHIDRNDLSKAFMRCHSPQNVENLHAHIKVRSNDQRGRDEHAASECYASD